MNTENEKDILDYFIINPTKSVDEKFVIETKPMITDEVFVFETKPMSIDEEIDLGIDEKNYSPLIAHRRLVGYVKKQD